MSDNHYDQLETRDPAQRELAQFNLLPDLIRHAMEKAPGWAAQLKDVHPGAVTTRAALAIPDAVWARSLDGLGLAKDTTLGFTAEQMANYGRDVYVTRPVATLFRDVRTIPRFTGKLSDTVLEASNDPSELVRIAFGLSDAVSGRMLERPKGAVRDLLGSMYAAFRKQ